MQAVVPAAGEGTRLRPLTADRPKALPHVDGRPILSYGLDALVDAGIEECIVVVGYRGDQIIDHYGDTYRDTPLTYVWQEDQRGLGHAVLQAESHVEGPFVVLNGDNVIKATLTTHRQTYHERGIDGLIITEEVSLATARETGVIVTDDAGNVKTLVEKPANPPSTLVNAGCYILPPSIFTALHQIEPSERDELELTDTIDHTLDTAFFDTQPLDGWRQNINTPGDIEKAEARLDGPTDDSR